MGTRLQKLGLFHDARNGDANTTWRQPLLSIFRGQWARRHTNLPRRLCRIADPAPVNQTPSKVLLPIKDHAKFRGSCVVFVTLFGKVTAVKTKPWQTPAQLVRHGTTGHPLSRVPSKNPSLQRNVTWKRAYLHKMTPTFILYLTVTICIRTLRRMTLRIYDNFLWLCHKSFFPPPHCRNGVKGRHGNNDGFAVVS